MNHLRNGLLLIFIFLPLSLGAEHQTSAENSAGNRSSEKHQSGDEWAMTIHVGSQFPEISGIDQLGKAQKNESLAGKNGLLFLFNRTTDW